MFSKKSRSSAKPLFFVFTETLAAVFLLAACSRSGLDGLEESAVSGGDASTPATLDGDADAGVAPDSSSDKAVVMLFGGTDNNPADPPFSDTWTWNGSAWTKLEVSGPSGRYGAMMAPLAAKLVLFGGTSGDGVELTDPTATWTWDGTAWTELDVSGPTLRNNSAMAALGDEIVLFGGFGSGPGDVDAHALADTWSWNGAAWTEIDGPGPPARQGAVMAPLGARLVLFGGVDLFPQDGGHSNWYADTWTWDGLAWTQLQVPGPPAREGAVLVPFEGKLVLYGGDCDCGATAGNAEVYTFYSDTWTWDGSAWTELSAVGSALTGAAMAPLDGQLVLFGGFVPAPSPGGGDLLSSVTTTWDGTMWTPVATNGPSARAQAAMATLP